MAFTKSQLLEVKAKHHRWLQQQPGMNGVGLGLTSEGEPCLKVFTDGMPETTKDQIRKRLGKALIEFEESGEFGMF